MACLITTMKPKHKSEEIIRMSRFLWIWYSFENTLSPTHSCYPEQEMNMISSSRSLRVSLWQIGILGTHATVLISCGDQFSVCIEQPTLSSNQYNPQLRPIWWSPNICQSGNYIEAERRMKNCIPCQAICCLPLPCDRDEYASNTLPRSVQLRTPSGPSTHIRTWLSIQWMPSLPFTTIGN